MVCHGLTRDSNKCGLARGQFHATTRHAQTISGVTCNCSRWRNTRIVISSYIHRAHNILRLTIVSVRLKEPGHRFNDLKCATKRGCQVAHSLFGSLTNNLLFMTNNNNSTSIPVRVKPTWYMNRAGSWQPSREMGGTKVPSGREPPSMVNL